MRGGIKEPEGRFYLALDTVEFGCVSFDVEIADGIFIRAEAMTEEGALVDGDPFLDRVRAKLERMLTDGAEP